MAKITLWGIPKHLWRMVTGVTSMSGKLLVWRTLLIVFFVFALWGLFAATGGAGTLFFVATVLISSIISQILGDDALLIWKNLWNAEWGEATI